MRDEVKRERRGCVGFPGARNPWEKVSQASQIQSENPITVVWVFLNWETSALHNSESQRLSFSAR